MNNLDSLISKIILQEQKFHEISNDITFDFELYHDEWGHTQDRKWRHGSGDKKIYDYHIVNLLEDAKDDITYNIIDKNIKHGKRFVVSRQGGDYLNIVIEPFRLHINEWRLVIITVMKKEDFTVSKGQLRIYV